MSRRQDRPRRRRLPDRQAERRRQQELPPRGDGTHTNFRAFGYAWALWQTILSPKSMYSAQYIYIIQNVFCQERNLLQKQVSFLCHMTGAVTGPGGQGSAPPPSGVFPG